MAGRIVVFGATGYTGRLVADALVELGARPVLAARSAEKLEQMAAALALREAGDGARRVQVGYFVSGSSTAGGMSGGTAASAAGFALEPTHSFHDGRIVRQRNAKSVTSFDVKGKARQAFSIGGTEQFSLPRLHRGLRDVDVYLG